MLFLNIKVLYHRAKNKKKKEIDDRGGNKPHIAVKISNYSNNNIVRDIILCNSLSKPKGESFDTF